MATGQTMHGKGTTWRALIGALILALGLSGVSGQVRAEGHVNLDLIVATVGETEITVGHMMVARANLPQEYQSIEDDALWDGLLEQLIQQEILAQSRDAEETPLVRLSMENEKRSMLAAVAITRAARRAVTEEEVQAIYQREYIDTEQGKEFNASHILLGSEEDALAVVAEVRGGADFATVAREKSTGPSGPNGGALGWFARGMMVEPFQVAVEQLSVGEIVGPVRTQFGYHVIKLNDVRAQEAPTLDEVRDTIEGDIQRDFVQKHIDDLSGLATVVRVPKAEFDTSVLSNLEALEE